MGFVFISLKYYRARIAPLVSAKKKSRQTESARQSGVKITRRGSFSHKNRITAKWRVDDAEAAA